MEGTTTLDFEHWSNKESISCSPLCGLTTGWVENASREQVKQVDCEFVTCKISNSYNCLKNNKYF